MDETVIRPPLPRHREDTTPTPTFWNRPLTQTIGGLVVMAVIGISFALALWNDTPSSSSKNFNAEVMAIWWNNGGNYQSHLTLRFSNETVKDAAVITGIRYAVENEMKKGVVTVFGTINKDVITVEGIRRNKSVEKAATQESAKLYDKLYEPNASMTHIIEKIVPHESESAIDKTIKDTYKNVKKSLFNVVIRLLY